jgi:hypothetical protein
MELAGCQDIFVRDERWSRRAFCLRDRRPRRGGPRRGVGRDSERKADTGTVAPLALAPPVDSDTVTVLKHIASTGAQLLSSAERMG